MAGDLRGVYLIGTKLDKLVTAVLVQDLASGDTSTLPLEEYVHRGVEPPDGTLPWEEDITPKPAAPSVRPFQPDPSKWGTSTFDDAAARIATSRSQRNDAVLNSGGTQVFPPPEPNAIATLEGAPDGAPPPGGGISPTIQATPITSSGVGVAGQEQFPSSGQMSPTIQVQPVRASPEIRVEAHSGGPLEINSEAHSASAGTAPHEMRLETGKYGLEGGSINAGAGGMVTNADVASAQKRVTTTIAANLATNLPDNRAVAKGLLQATQIKITELRDARRNDRETTDLVEFLEWLAQGLTELGENIDRAIANPSEPMFLGAAGEIVQKLKSGLFEAVEKNRVRVWEIGALVGVGCFLTSLSGGKLSDILNALFNRK